LGDLLDFTKRSLLVLGGLLDLDLWGWKTAKLKIMLVQPHSPQYS
jgi:hypothetical protein